LKISLEITENFEIKNAFITSEQISQISQTIAMSLVESLLWMGE